MSLRWLILIFLASLTLPNSAPARRSSSLFQRYNTESHGRKNTVSTGDKFHLSQRDHNHNNMATKSNRSVLKVSWTTVEEPKPRDFQVHDLITVIVNEVSKHSTKADSKTEREYELDLKLEDWISLSGGNLRPDQQSQGNPKIKFSGNRDFEGKGNIKREDTLTARIQAEIIDVLPNGNLVLEASHSVVTDGETTTIKMTGTCRSKDVGIGNSIMSSQCSHFKIWKKHTGMARDNVKRGWLAAFLDLINPL